MIKPTYDELVAALSDAIDVILFYDAPQHHVFEIDGIEVRASEHLVGIYDAAWRELG